MRVVITGGTGFVGGNVARVLELRGSKVLCAVRTPADSRFPWQAKVVDLGCVDALVAVLDAWDAEAIVHCAIYNDLAGIYHHRRMAYDAYVSQTRSIVEAANRCDVRVVYVSSDWVFDGTDHMVREDEPVNPVNFYGVLKALSEQVVLDGAPRGIVCRIGGVNGIHVTKRSGPREQDAGLGHFVSALVSRLSSGRTFGVWESDNINCIATPIVASEVGALIDRALHLDDVGGVFHMSGATAASRRELAEAACYAFGLDQSLLRFVAPPSAMLPPGALPFDTSLGSDWTMERLGCKAWDLARLMDALREEIRVGDVRPITPPLTASPQVRVAVKQRGRRSGQS